MKRKRKRNWRYMYQNWRDALFAFAGLAALIGLFVFAGALGLFLILAIAVLAIFEKHAGFMVLAGALVFIAWQMNLF